MQIRKKMVFYHIFLSVFCFQELLGMEIEDELIKTQVTADVVCAYNERRTEIQQSQKIYLNNPDLREEQYQYLKNRVTLSAREKAQLYNLQNNGAVHINGVRSEQLLSQLKETLEVSANEFARLDDLGGTIRAISLSESQLIQSLLDSFHFKSESALDSAIGELRKRIGTLKLMIDRLSYRQSEANQKIKIKHTEIMKLLQRDSAYRLQHDTIDVNELKKRLLWVRETLELFPEG